MVDRDIGVEELAIPLTPSTHLEFKAIYDSGNLASDCTVSIRLDSTDPDVVIYQLDFQIALGITALTLVQDSKINGGWVGSRKEPITALVSGENTIKLAFGLNYFKASLNEEEFAEHISVTALQNLLMMKIWTTGTCLTPQYDTIYLKRTVPAVHKGYMFECKTDNVALIVIKERYLLMTNEYHSP